MQNIESHVLSPLLNPRTTPPPLVRFFVPLPLLHLLTLRDIAYHYVLNKIQVDLNIGAPRHVQLWLYISLSLPKLTF